MSHTTNCKTVKLGTTYEKPQFELFEYEEDPDLSDEEIAKICSTMESNPWIHDGIYESIGIKPGEEISLKNYKQIKYTSRKGYVGITERKQNGDVRVTFIRPDGTKSVEINYGVMDGKELTEMIDNLENHDEIGMEGRYVYNISRLAAEKNMTEEEAWEYYREQNRLETNESINEALMAKGFEPLNFD